MKKETKEWEHLLMTLVRYFCDVTQSRNSKFKFQKQSCKNHFCHVQIKQNDMNECKLVTKSVIKINKEIAINHLFFGDLPLQILNTKIIIKLKTPADNFCLTIVTSMRDKAQSKV
jgi:hypothetical protein